MKAINKYRADAHAKDLNNDEMSYFRLSISSIEGFVDQYLS